MYNNNNNEFATKWDFIIVIDSSVVDDIFVLTNGYVIHYFQLEILYQVTIHIS